jgi:hypothetical protein
LNEVELHHLLVLESVEGRLEDCKLLEGGSVVRVVGHRSGGKLSDCHLGVLEGLQGNVAARQWEGEPYRHLPGLPLLGLTLLHAVVVLRVLPLSPSLLLPFHSFHSVVVVLLDLLAFPELGAAVPQGALLAVLEKLSIVEELALTSLASGTRCFHVTSAAARLIF